jgi:hypothetical protein
MRTVDKARMLIAFSALPTTALRAVCSIDTEGFVRRAGMALLGVLGSRHSISVVIDVSNGQMDSFASSDIGDIYDATFDLNQPVFVHSLRCGESRTI